MYNYVEHLSSDKSMHEILKWPKDGIDNVRRNIISLITEQLRIFIINNQTEDWLYTNGSSGDMNNLISFWTSPFSVRRCLAYSTANGRDFVRTVIGATKLLFLPCAILSEAICASCADSRWMRPVSYQISGRPWGLPWSPTRNFFGASSFWQQVWVGWLLAR